MPDDSAQSPDPGSPDSGNDPGPTPDAPPSAPAGGAVASTGGAGGLPPQGAPGAQQNIPLGAQVNGLRRLQIATKIIETTLPMFGSHTREGRVVIDVLNRLSKEFGGDGSRSQDPMDAVMRRQIMANRAQPPAGPPGAGMPGGGGMMPGMPPGGPPGGMPPGGGPGPLPTPNRGPVPQPRVA